MVGLNRCNRVNISLQFTALVAIRTSWERNASITRSPPGSPNNIANAADESRIMLCTLSLFLLSTSFLVLFRQKLVQNTFQTAALGDDRCPQFIDGHLHAED